MDEEVQRWSCHVQWCPISGMEVTRAQEQYHESNMSRETADASMLMLMLFSNR